jgi:hypothetical protein
VTTADELFLEGLKKHPGRPGLEEQREDKKAYSERSSHLIAPLFGEVLRRRGLKEAMPSDPGEGSISGAERRMSGGLGAKKVDVTWTTEASGLMLALSIKTINYSFSNNLTNRRGDLLYESVTLHRRFPFSVLGGFLFFSSDAERHVFTKAHALLKIFTGRRDPAGREEQYEGLYIGLIDANPFNPRLEISEAGRPDDALTLEQIFDALLVLVAERNPDFYTYHNGTIKKASSRRKIKDNGEGS